MLVCYGFLNLDYMNIQYKLIIFILLLVTKVEGQVKSGNVTYGIMPIQLEYGENLSKDAVVEIKERITIAEKQNFILTFNSEKSKFVQKKILEVENNQEKFINGLSSIAFTTNFDFYTDLTRNVVIIDKGGTLVEKNIDKESWVVSNESKTIDKYLCYKATKNITYFARDGKEKQKTITAWFAPSIPFLFGPKEYLGLPGLILELQDKQTIFYAKSISLADDKTVNVEFPKGKPVKEDDYNNSSK
jgi:GLPGLI family protein